MCEIHPDVTPVGAGHSEDRLAMGFGAAGFRQAAAIHPKYLMAADRGQHEAISRQGPAFQMRHLVDRQGFFAAAIARQDALRDRRILPKIDGRQTVFTEQASDVTPAVGGNKRIVRVQSNVPDLHNCGFRPGQIGDPNLPGIPKREHEAPARRVDQPDRLRAR